MDSLIPLLLLGFVVLVFGLPVGAWVTARRSARNLKDLQRRVDGMEHELTRLRARQPDSTTVPAPAKAVAVEPIRPVRSRPPGPTPAVESSVIAGPAVTPPPLVASLKSEVRPEPVKSAAPPRLSPVGAAASPPVKPNASPINWEQFMGVKLFAWLGGLALFLAVAYFVKYSFEHNLVPPQVRVALGFMMGLGLLVGGVKLHRPDYRVTAQTLCATGTVILYAATFAGHAVYHFPLFGQVPTFLVMTLITGTAFRLSLRLNALVVAILGMLGGFLTPLLLSTGTDNPGGLFSYIALLDVGLIAVAWRRRWSFLVGLSALGTVLMQFAWVAEFFTAPKAAIALAIFLGFAVLYLVGAVVARRAERPTAWWFVGSSVALSLVAMLFTFVLMTFPALAARPGLLATLLFGGDLCLLALALLRPRAAVVQMVGGLVAFCALAAWTVGFLQDETLSWGLALYLGFGVLHSVAPLVIRRFVPQAVLPVWVHLFAPLSLILVVLPLMKLAATSLLVWVVVLLVDLVAIALALVTASMAALVGALLLTVGILFVWIARVPADVLSAPVALMLIGLFALLFCGAGWFGARWLERQSATSGLAPMRTGVAWLDSQGQAQIPALSAVLPFTLLLLMTARLTLPNPSGVFGLALLLLVLLLALALALRIEILPAIGLGCVLALEHVWQARQFGPGSSPGLVLGWYVLLAGVFVAFPFVFRQRLQDQVIPWAVGALSAPLHFFLVHRLFQTAWPNQFMGLVPLVCALPMLACLWVIVRRFPVDHARRNAVLAWFGGAALFFITLVFPIQFDRQWITVGWALEGAALCWLFHRIPHPGLRGVGVGLLVVVFVRLVFNPAVLTYHPRADAAIFNWYLYAYGVAAAAFFAAARLLAPPRHLVLQTNVPPIFRGLGTVLVFLLINIEIADYFTEPGRGRLTFQFGGLFARDMSYTIAWALFALLLLVVGLVRRARPARYAGIALLAVTLLKLFFHDLANLAQLYRIGALAGVAIVAILASFLYQRFLAKSGAESPPTT